MVEAPLPRILLIVCALALAGCGHASDQRSGKDKPRAATGTPIPLEQTGEPLALKVTQRASLPVTVPSGAAVAIAGKQFLAAGGVHDRRPSADVLRVDPGATGRIGGLPEGLHGAAATTIGGYMYAFGGTTATGPTDAIVRLGKGGAKVVGHLPAPVTDATAVPADDRVYIVGGTSGALLPASGSVGARPRRGPTGPSTGPSGPTGAASADGSASSATAATTDDSDAGADAGSDSEAAAGDPTAAATDDGSAAATASDTDAPTDGDAGPTGPTGAGGSAGAGATGPTGLDEPDGLPLRSVIEWKPGSNASVVAKLPVGVRNAAAGLIDGRIFVAGGSDGMNARRDVVRVDLQRHTTRTIAQLPQPLAHAAGAALHGTFYVFGGRTVSAIEPISGALRPAVKLPVSLDDASAIATKGRIKVLSGSTVLVLATDPHPPDESKRVAARTPVPETPDTGIPPLPDPHDVYGADRHLAPLVKHDPARVYVPNTQSDTVDVVSQRTGKVVDHFAVGGEPQHVTPSYDLKTLWVTNDHGNSLTPINPRTGKHGEPVPVLDPYNLYFTPDGRRAIVVAEAHKRLDFREPHTMALKHSLEVPQCAGVDHMDYTADGHYALVSCEFAGRMIVVDLETEKLVKTIDLKASAMPQDVKLSPDGQTFYVADMATNGVWLIDANSMTKIRFQPTGKGAHGLYPSRDGKTLYVSNREEGTISLISFATRHPYKRWKLPGGGSPDMGGVSADGRMLWLTGRYNAELYGISTKTGKLIHRVKVGSGPHGACVWPQPGRYSIGHTGILR